MEQSGTSALLQGVVQDLASGVASALRGGGHAPFPGGAPPDERAQGVLLAAVRVLGADVLLPRVLDRTPPAGQELAVFRGAIEAFRPQADAAPTVRRSHWGMVRGLRTVDAAHGPAHGDAGAEPDAGWLYEAPWQSVTHRLSVLAALALPGEDCALNRAAQHRVVDVSRGFVRAVRRATGALRATPPHDLLTFLEAHLGPDTTPIPGALRAVRTPLLRRGLDHRHVHTLTWFRHPTDGGPMYFHSGATLGQQAFLGFRPGTAVAAVCTRRFRARDPFVATAYALPAEH
ncbi:penicillin-binding protein [Streptomyces sp. bgisy159]|uniref:penicillin-binding protein n=1 Tax=Streptomyces sp. bgisy159 TaxID=3413795 RepID=UPI003F49D946